MSDKRRWPLAEARAVAERWLALISPVCERVKIVGSVRREKPEVGDIEIVYVARLEPQVDDLFGAMVFKSVTDLLFEAWLGTGALAKRPNINGAFTWGPMNKLAVDRASGIPVDFFAATAEGWWRSLVIRTGPRDLNVRLITQASRRGIKVHAYGEPALAHLTTGEPVVCESERHFFELCGVLWAEPRDRR